MLGMNGKNWISGGGAFLLYLLAVSSNAQVAEVNHETLRLVQLVFRHGDRVPEYPYPQDPYKDESTWPEGWAQLTDEGKQQEYNLGQYLRERYGNYLNATYVPNQVHVLSSDTDRTIMSALLATAGLFPTNNESNWNNSINWQPVPLHTVFTDNDNVNPVAADNYINVDTLIRMKRKCPKFDKLFDDFLRTSHMMATINEENKQLYETLSKNSGVNITTINDIDSFYATLFVEEYKGLEIPEWGRSLKTDEHFQYLYNLSFQAKTYTPELQRLRAGELVKYLVNNVNERVRNSTMKTKMFMLSGHDVTLIDLMNTLGVLDLHRPWYSSVFIIELHQEPSGSFFLEFHLRNDTSRPPYQLTMPGCKFQCPLQSFINFTQPIIPDDWDLECQLNQPDSGPSSAFTYVLVIAGFAALAALIVGIVCMCLNRMKRSRQKYQYERY